MVEAWRVDRDGLLLLGAVNFALLVGLVTAHWLVVAAAAVAIPAVLLLAARPQRGVLLLAALVPFNGLLLVVPHPSFVAGWKEALTLATLGATFVAPASARCLVRRRPPAWAAAAAGLIAVGAVSAALVVPRQGFEGMKVSFFYVLVAWAVWRCPLSTKERDVLVTLLMADGIITAFYGIAQEVLGPARLNALGYHYNTAIRTAGGHLRAFSSFNQPFPFAFFLVMAIVIGLPVALREPGRLRSRLFLLALPVLAVALATTIVRAAWVGLGVGLVFLAVHRHRRLLFLIPAALLVLVLLPSNLTSSAVSSSSSKVRVDGWLANLNRLEQHPFGVGIGSTGSAAEKIAGANPAASATYQADDYYVKTALELGVPGLWLLLMLLGSAFMSSRELAQRTDANEASFGTGVAALVLAAVTASTTAAYFEIFPVDVLFWLYLGVAASIWADPPGYRALPAGLPEPRAELVG